MEKISLGALESPYDYRDKYATDAALAYAETNAEKEEPVHLDLSKIPVLMQGKRPACVSNAMVTLMMAYFYKRTGRIIRFSPRFLDTYVKTFDGLPLEGTGAYPRFVFKAAATVGCATEDVLPNDITMTDTAYRNPERLSDAVMQNAAKYKIPGFIRIDMDRESRRRALRLFGPASILMRIGSEWWLPSWGTMKFPLDTPRDIVSGHQVVMKDDDAINVLRNSWSEAWGQKGDGTYDAVAWEPYIVEMWVIADVPNDIKTFLKNLPSPDEFHYHWKKDMKYGEKSDDIKFAQIALMILGFMDPVPEEHLGIYGPKTVQAVLAYQKAKRIYPTWAYSIGPKTRAALNSDFSL